MVNLSLGLAYVHYALKRQSVNRQYLILQGFCFMARYVDHSAGGIDRQRTISELHYNLGRLYHLLGITSLASRHYRCGTEVPSDIYRGVDNVRAMGWINQMIMFLTLDQKELALAMLKKQLVL